jgi:hypothetical protein
MKIYIIAPTFTAYFIFIQKLFEYKFIKEASKERQILVLFPEQLRGIKKQIIFLLDGAEKQNPKFKDINQVLQERKGRNTVIGCSPVINQGDFAKLILAASS